MVTALAGRTEISGIDEHVIHILDIGVDRAVERVVEQGEVKADVVLCCRLPLEVGVGQLGGAVAGGEGAGSLQSEVVGGGGDTIQSIVHDIESELCVVVDGLVARLAPRKAQLGIVEPVVVEQLREAESERGGGESTPAAVLSET